MTRLTLLYTGWCVTIKVCDCQQVTWIACQCVAQHLEYTWNV